MERGGLIKALYYFKLDLIYSQCNNMKNFLRAVLLLFQFDWKYISEFLTKKGFLAELFLPRILLLMRVIE